MVGDDLRPVDLALTWGVEIRVLPRQAIRAMIYTRPPRRREEGLGFILFHLKEVRKKYVGYA